WQVGVGDGEGEVLAGLVPADHLPASTPIAAVPDSRLGLDNRRSTRSPSSPHGNTPSMTQPSQLIPSGIIRPHAHARCHHKIRARAPNAGQNPLDAAGMSVLSVMGSKRAPEPTIGRADRQPVQASCFLLAMFSSIGLFGPSLGMMAHAAR